MRRGPENSGAHERQLLPATAKIIEILRVKPTAAFGCLHDDGPAVGIYESPGGCVAFRGVETQALCPQHVITNGAIQQFDFIVDLTINGAWGEYRGETPLFYIAQGESGECALQETA